MNWHKLTTSEQLQHIKQASIAHPILIFKHSTRCSTSALALSRLERAWKENNVTPYFLDLLSYREISRKIEEEFKVTHESPQVLLIKGGQSVYDASHMAISFDEISKHF